MYAIFRLVRIIDGNLNSSVDNLRMKNSPHSFAHDLEEEEKKDRFSLFLPRRRCLLTSLLFSYRTEKKGEKKSTRLLIGKRTVVHIKRNNYCQ